MTDDDRALIERLFPDLEIRTFVPLGDGWTAATYEVNGGWVVRLPRSAWAADRLRPQIGLLPELSRELSALVPVPERVSTDPPAMLSAKLEGMPADRAPDGIWPERLGRFLYDLHLVPPEFVGMRASPAVTVRDRLREELGGLHGLVRPLLSSGEAARTDALVSGFLDDERLWSFATCLTHGDLVSEHVLVGDGGDLVGVLGWKEAGVGDPASDFAWWLHAMPEHGERALAAYGGAPDAAFRERGRALYAFMPWYEVEHGLATGQERSVESGLSVARARLP